MKVLITGGAGYIGTELVRQLAHADSVDEVVIYDNLSRKNFNLFLFSQLPSDKVTFEEGELLDSRRLNKALKDVDVVIHLAARVTTPFASQDPHYFEQVNHWGTAELVYAVEESPVKQFIYASSSSVYGFAEKPQNETSSPDPQTYYGFSKKRGEEHVERLKDKVNTQIIRLGNVYGFSPSMRFDAVINRFMLEANFNNRISVNGSGDQHRSFIHVDKVVQAFQEILEKEVPSGTYNMVDRNLTVNEIAETVQALYPGLEVMYINQHLDLKELQVAPESKLYEYLRLPETQFKEELTNFKQHFAFHPYG